MQIYKSFIESLQIYLNTLFTDIKSQCPMWYWVETDYPRFKAIWICNSCKRNNDHNFRGYDNNYNTYLQTKTSDMSVSVIMCI